MAFVFPYSTFAQRESPSALPGISPYWNSDVNRWTPFILSAAEERSIDPDLIAAVIWKESLGRAWERGPVGAVGLMGVMPFEWRPSADELQNPWINVDWGASTLSQIIRDGKGDLYYALAAYNGGWDQVHLRVTRNYAADVLGHYARAVAVRHGLPADGNWVAIFNAAETRGANTITTVGPQRSPARYTERPWVQANIPAVPIGVSPHSTVTTFVDTYGVERQVHVWLIAADNSPLEPATTQVYFSPSADDYTRAELYTHPTPTPNPSPLLTPDPDSDTEPAQPADPTSAPPPVADPNVLTPTLVTTPTLPAPGPTITVAIPTLTPAPVPTSTTATTPTVECPGGPLQLNAWHIEKEWTDDGWAATIFVQGHGGDCSYTYAWNGEVKGGPMSGSMTFKVYQVELESIFGTASISSAGETVEVGLLIQPTGD